MPEFHSRFAPSSAKSWLACDAHIPLTDGIESKSTEYAEEGTAAHDVNEASFRQGAWPADFRGQTFNDFVVDDEMIDACDVFVTFCRTLITQFPKAYWQPEQRFESPRFADHGGTVDFHLRDTAQSLLHVVDYKHGAGVPVEAVNNEQLMCYALLMWEGERYIRMTIVQPRIEHRQGPVRTWQIDGEQLQAFSAQVEAAITRSELATQVLADATDLRGHLGLFKINDGCRWCAIHATCPAHFALAESEAAELLSVVPAEGEPERNLRSPDTLDFDRLAVVLSKAATIRKWLKAVEDHATEQATLGIEIHGWKLVEATGNTRWSLDDAEMLRKFRNKGLGKSLCVNEKLKSFNQMKTVVKTIDGADVAWLNKFTQRPVTGLKLVPESDKRLAYTPANASDDYQHVPVAIEEGEN